MRYLTAEMWTQIKRIFNNLSRLLGRALGNISNSAQTTKEIMIAFFIGFLESLKDRELIQDIILELAS